MGSRLKLTYQDEHQLLAQISDIPSHLLNSTLSAKPDLVISVPVEPDSFTLLSIYANGLIVEYAYDFGEENYPIWLWNTRKLKLSQVPSLLAEALLVNP